MSRALGVELVAAFALEYPRALRPPLGARARMKRDILNMAALVAGVLVLAIGTPILVRQVRSLPSQSLPARGDQRVVTLEVGGMTCAGCAQAVEKSLTGLPGVTTAAVRFPQRRAYVVCDPQVTDTALVAAVRRAGPGYLAAITRR